MAQKPLDEAGGAAPKISFRLSRPQHERVIELAETSGETVSELIDRELERADGEPLASDSTLKEAPPPGDLVQTENASLAAVRGLPSPSMLMCPPDRKATNDNPAGRPTT